MKPSSRISSCVCIGFVSLFSVACDPVVSAGVAVAPAPFAVEPSATLMVVAESLLLARGLEPVGPNAGWHQCYGRSNFHVCTAIQRDTIFLDFFQLFVARFAAPADSVREALIQRLTASSGRVMLCSSILQSRRGLSCKNATPRYPRDRS